MCELDGVSNAHGPLKPRARRAAARLLVAVLASTVVVAAAADSARAQLAISHWPHSPVRHRLRAAGSSVTPSFTANLRGNFTTCVQHVADLPRQSATHRQRTARGHRRRAAEPCVGRNNNDENMRYVNVDPAGHFNSSAATVTLPANARVVRAYLYWGADLARGVNNGAADGAPGGETPETRPSPDPRGHEPRCGRRR